jgi:hypothetical protein
MHIYKHDQSHIIIFHNHVSGTPLTIIWAPYNNANSVQITEQKSMIKPPGVSLDFLWCVLCTYSIKLYYH